MHEFDRFRRVQLRDIWPHEVRDFTPWLAENLIFLAEDLNMDLELEATEKRVGDFRADIVCRNRTDNSRVIIENQLEKSNHPHLGKVLTYAAGLDAATIIWIAEKFRPESKEKYISLSKSDTDPTDETDWQNQHEWLAAKIEKFNEVFRPRIKALNAADWEPPEDEDEV